MPRDFYQNNLFGVLVGIVFSAVILIYWHILSIPIRPEGLAYTCLLVVMAYGFSYDSTSLLLSICLPKRLIPKINSLSCKPKVALLYLTCDDVDLSIARKINQQTYSCLNIFVLDDSLIKEERAKVDTLPYEIVRRSNRSGFKAGNINNWLQIHGEYYDYIFVCDADSVLPLNAVEELVKYAEHIDNAHIAIFETLIVPWNTDNEFVKVQHAAAKVSGRIKVRVENLMRTTLSVGHNNLIRIAALKEVGGFNEKYIAEDYATSLDLFRTKRWECKTVPLETYERAPEDLSEFVNREIRWTLQTFQLHSSEAKHLTFNLLVRLLGAFYHYSAPFLFFVGLLILGSLTIVSNISGSGETTNYMWPVHSSTTASKWFTCWLLFITAPLILSAFVMKAERLNLATWLKNSVFHAGVIVSMLLPLIRRLQKLKREKTFEFDVTGYNRRHKKFWLTSDYLLVQASVMGASVFLLWSDKISILNLIWIIPVAVAPSMIRLWERKTEV